MTTIYTFDQDRFYTGAVECDPLGPVPAGALTPPPTLTGLQFAQWSGSEWVVVGQSSYDARAQAVLASTKAAKTEQINRWRAEANKVSFTFMGKQIAMDDTSNKDIDKTTAYIVLWGTLPPDFPGGWKTLDNSYVAIPSVAVWKDFIAALVAQGVINFAKSNALKSTLAAATTAEQVNAIVWGA